MEENEVNEKIHNPAYHSVISLRLTLPYLTNISLVLALILKFSGIFLEVA